MFCLLSSKNDKCRSKIRTEKVSRPMVLIQLSLHQVDILYDNVLKLLNFVNCDLSSSNSKRMFVNINLALFCWVEGDIFVMQRFTANSS